MNKISRLLGHSQFIPLPSLLIQHFVHISVTSTYVIIYLVYMSVFPSRLQAPLGRGPCLIHLFISSDYHKAWLIVGTQMFVGWTNEWMHVYISNNGVTITSLVNSYQFFQKSLLKVFSVIGAILLNNWYR